MSHYPPNPHRDSDCKCKYCLAHNHNHQQRLQQRLHNSQRHRRASPHMGHLSGGGSFPVEGGGLACGHSAGKSSPRYQKLEEPSCCRNKGNSGNTVEDGLENRKINFQELRKTWSEFARVCNCPNCKGSLQKERYLGKLAESADRASVYKNHRFNGDDECCCSSNTSHDCKPMRLAMIPNGYEYDQEFDGLHHEEYHMHHQNHQQPENHMSSCPSYEVSSEEQLVDPSGNVGCKCLMCTHRAAQNVYMNGGEHTPVTGGAGPKCGGVKRHRMKHHY